MLQRILHILLILSSSLLIYFGNNTLLEINLFLLIILSILNTNYYSFFSIIPLFFINQNLFIIFMVLWLLLFILNIKIKGITTRKILTSLIIILYIIYILVFDNIAKEIITPLLMIIIPVLLINIYRESISKQLTYEVLFLSISILGIGYINTYIFLIVSFVFILAQSILFDKPYYIVTAFLITIYGVVKTENILYTLIQLFAYLGYLFNYLKTNKNSNGQLEFILEDINNNVTSFCNFLNHFSQITYNSDYEKKLSSAINILIESYCLTCKNKSVCYANKKLKTYIYLKDLLTKKGQANPNETKDFFECKHYFFMREKAQQLQNQYNLISGTKIEDLKIYGVCNSVQNYFISLFEKITPKMLILINFKKMLVDKNINYTSFYHSITNESVYEFKIYANSTNDLIAIYEVSVSYFKKMNANVDKRDGYIAIYPKKKFKVIYDFASLSLNNCQISGDNILFKTLSDVNFVCALSDGMGSGYRAYQLSQDTLKMVDNITNCNISFETSLQIINNFFKTRDLADSYATLDLVDINLVDGILNLYKLGSSTTYISRGDKIIPIYNNNLPFGISELIIKEEYSIANGDLIILVSDGISDYINEDVLIQYIETLKNELPHKIVYEILQKIYYDNGNKIKDDMSCVAIKIKNC